MLNTGLFILRVFVGLQMAAHGSQKLFGWFGGHGPEGTGGYFESLGFRPGKHFAVAAAIGELGGGLLLVLGLLTPLGSAALIGVMVTAIATVHLDKGFFAQDGGYELPLLIAIVAVAVAFTGPGAASLDAAIGWNLATPWYAFGAIVLGLLGAGAALAARAQVRHHAGQRASA